jgi:hypothetical protein
VYHRGPRTCLTPHEALGLCQLRFLSIFDVRIVAPGSTNCATSFGGLPDVTNLPALPAGSSATIAAEGELNPGDGGGQPFGLKAYIDDATVTAGKAKLRFVHASSGTPAVDVGLGGGVLFTPVFTNVAFGNTATATNGSIAALQAAGHVLVGHGRPFVLTWTNFCSSYRVGAAKASPRWRPL